MTLRVAYLAHPVAADTPEGVAANLDRARRWLRALIEWYPDRAWVMSWLPYLEVLPDSGASRERGLRDDLAIVARCDELWLCGAHLSNGMAREFVAAQEHGLTIYNLIGTSEPPARAPGCLLPWWSAQ